MAKILIIEDDLNIANAEAMILSDHSVKVANDGEAGLKMAKKFKPDLIILDLMLPNRGGYDVCFHLRQDDLLKNVKVIMVTAKSQDIDKKKGVFVGADAYLTKPFEPSQLLELVKQHL